MRANATLAVAMVAVLAASCGATASEEASGQGSASAAPEVACSEIGAIRFPATYLTGPEFDVDSFVATEPGAVLESFFGGGDGTPENHSFVAARGFSIVSDELILGYSDGLPESFFELERDDVTGWGGCIPTLVRGDLVAYRWHPVSAADPDATAVPIEVVGGACVTDNGTEEVTEIVAVDVDEDAERVAITVWVRDTMGALGIEMCAGVGIFQQTEAALAAPLGDRILLDAGVVPAAPPVP